MNRLRRPDAVGGAALAAAACIWIGTAVGRTGWVAAGYAAVGLAAVAGRRRHTLLVALAAVGMAAGLASHQRADVDSTPSLPDGPAAVTGVAVTDERIDRYGARFVVRPTDLNQHAWRGPPTLVVLDAAAGVARGATVTVHGLVTAERGRHGAVEYSARMRVRTLGAVGAERGLLPAAANRVRSRVTERLAPWSDDPAAGLVAGFLIGDVRQVPGPDRAALTETGLSHFVAVSGSNVALFLGIWWILAGPFAFGPRRRAVFGVVGLVLFVLITRGEPSVLRASVMAGLVLVGRAAGVPLSGWSALGAASGGLLLVAPQLGDSVGFQLSVAATLGVMAGAELFQTPRWPPLGMAWSATLGAQAAVTPILLWHFGQIPVVSPLANLLATPAVAISTLAGAVGIGLGFHPAVEVAVGAARFVLAVAHAAAGWPSVGVLGVPIVALFLWGLRSRQWRGVVAVSACAVVLVWSGRLVPPVDVPAVVFVDVGQGDAAIVFGPGDEVVLIDGGPDPVAMVSALRRYGVDRIDLVVVSHPHEDHIGGLPEVVERFDVGHVWHPGHDSGSTTFTRLLTVAAARGTPVSVVRSPLRASVGAIGLSVVGPVRRYAGPNDESLVVIVSAGSTEILFAGDVEELAQREIPATDIDILKVPHHGSDTSDLEWLVAGTPDVAVISVGVNDFGHPHPDVVEGLQREGIVVRRTDRDGDVVVPLR